MASPLSAAMSKVVLFTSQDEREAELRLSGHVLALLGTPELEAAEAAA